MLATEEKCNGRLRTDRETARLRVGVPAGAAIACEHYRSRFNRALGVRPAGFSEGVFCVRPEI
jgi:hypothetical protein